MGFLDSLGKSLGKVFGTRNERMLKSYEPIIEKINSFAESMVKLTDSDMVEKTNQYRNEIKKRIEDSNITIDKNEPIDIQDEKRKKIFDIEQNYLDEILPEAFALVREAGRRFMTPVMRHFDVQLIGGLVLHKGMIAEMVTGEGKTLVATLPAYLNALPGHGVHVVTVNDYLAQRDRDWMAPIYEGLGLTVGAIQSEMNNQERQTQYNCDITYGTNNEFGFDYLRDNMKIDAKEQVQRHRYFSVVDEVDSILIDEARTPLIISGPAQQSTEVYYLVNKLGRMLVEGEDFDLNEKDHSVGLTEAGLAKSENILNIGDLFSGKNIEVPHFIDNALRAWHLYKRDRDYVVKDGEIIIVDEFTGRLMPGRRWSDGLHQAVEAKENMRIKEENQTLATITLQNYFLLYDKLSGMTGTALTEAGEFMSIYKLDVIVIPTNKILLRKNHPDVIYGSQAEKYQAIIDEIKYHHNQGRPVLVGTTSIEKSEKISTMLKHVGLEHEVLNAKHHQREAEIVAQAGQMSKITVATNMAGRGTDIVLGDGVANAGGLHVIGTERHESRRIDNQLRGRCGRQGDPGSSRFFLALDDDLMRIFASDTVANILRRVGLSEGQPLESRMVTRAIEKSQKAVEERHFESRKNLLEYDKVMDDQRRLIYTQRQEILSGIATKDNILKMFDDVIELAVDAYISSGYDAESDIVLAADEHFDIAAEDSESLWDYDGFSSALKRKCGEDITPENIREMDRDEIINHCINKAKVIFEQKIKEYKITWDFEGLRSWTRSKLGVDITPEECQDKKAEEISDILYDHALNQYNKKEEKLGREIMMMLERYIMLQILDSKWKDHLYAMDHLRESVGFRGYGGKDPKSEYKKEGFAMFRQMINNISEEVTDLILKVEFKDESDAEVRDSYRGGKAVKEDFGGYKGNEGEGISNEPLKPFVRREAKIGRNDPCPCGSGKKYKKCCAKKVTN